MTTVLGKLLGYDKRLYEYVFAADSLTAFAEQSSVEDWRSMGDKLLFRKLRPNGPAWSTSPEGAQFASGGGALGVGSLWTRPVRLEPLPFEGAHVQIVERREVEGGAGGVSLIAHVRDRPVVGEAKDVATEVFRLHAHDDPGDATWHATVLDLTEFLRAHLAADRYLTFEVRVESLRAARSPRAIAVSLRPPALTLVAGGAASENGQAAAETVPRAAPVVETKAT